MKPSVTILLDQAQKKMSGYAALLNYRFINLSVKALPEALLSVVVSAEGESMPIEQAALARHAAGKDDRFEIYPKNRSLLGPVVAGLKLAHPEYKLELKDISGSEDAEGVKDQYVLATVPEVDDARHNQLKEAVETLSGRCDDLLKLVQSDYSDRIHQDLDGASPAETEEADEALKNLYDKHDKLCKQFRSEKEKEIEQAYEKYKQKNQKASANGPGASANAGKQMRMTSGYDD